MRPRSGRRPRRRRGRRRGEQGRDLWNLDHVRLWFYCFMPFQGVLGACEATY